MLIYTASYYRTKLSPLVRELTWFDMFQFIKLDTLSRELKKSQNKTLNTVEINYFNTTYSLIMKGMRRNRNALTSLKELLG